MTEEEFNNLVERLKTIFQPRTELAKKLPNIKEVEDMTEVAYEKNGKKIIAKAVNGKWIETYTEGNSTSGIGDMLKSVYDTNDNGVVDNSKKLNGHSSSATPVANAIPVADGTGKLDSWVTGGGGSGDMLKSTYDTNNNGMVDNSEKLGGYSVATTPSANKVPISNGLGSLNAWVDGTSITNITYSAASSAISGSTLVVGQLYKITDRNIILLAISNNQFSTSGVYLYSGGIKARASVELAVTPGGSGTVSNLAVGGVTIASLPISIPQTFYTTTRNTNVPPKATISYEDTNYTGTQIIANAINSYGLYKAYAMGANVGIIKKANGSDSSSVIMSGANITSVSGSLSGGSNNPTKPLIYRCFYDFAYDMLLELFDPLYNNVVRQSKVFQNANGNTILDFDWNNPSVYNNVIEDSIVEPNFIYGTGIYANNQVRGSKFGANHISSGEIKGNILIDSEMTGNYISSGYLNYNKLVRGGGGYVYQDYPSQMNYNTINSSGNVQSNRLVGGAWFNNNTVVNHSTFHSNNMFFYSTFIFNSQSGNNARMFDNEIHGRYHISGNNFDNTLFYDTDIKDDGLIIDCYYYNCLLGDGAIVSCNWLNMDLKYVGMLTSSHYSDWIDGWKFYGKNPSRSWLYLSSAPLANSTKINFIMEMDGSAVDSGAIGTSEITQLRAKTYVYEIRITALGLTANAACKISIGWDGVDDALMPATLVTDLKTNPEYLVQIASANVLIASAEKTPLTLSITGGAATSGELRIMFRTNG